jgi:hypothetical protein
MTYTANQRGALIADSDVAKNAECSMDSTVQAGPDSGVSEAGPIAVEDMVAARPQTPQSVLNREPCVPPAYEEGVSGKPPSNGTDLIEEAAPTVKSISKPGLDDRKSPRCPVPPARQSCELKVGGKVLSALLVNESEGGFAVLIDRADGLKVGKKVELRMGTRSSTVKIVYIRKVARPQNVAGEGDCWFHLGMKKASGSFFSLFS